MTLGATVVTGGTTGVTGGTTGVTGGTTGVTGGTTTAVQDAKKVVAAVMGAEKSAGVVSAAFENQPLKVYPTLEGSAGRVTVPPGTIDWGAVLLPRPLSNETVTGTTALHEA